jgi:hypothetical protein
MGRAVLIIAIAAILGLGTMMFSSQQTRIATTKTTGDYEYQVLARDVARSGVDRGLSETKRSLSDVRSSWDDVEVAGGEYDLKITEVAYGDMDIASTGVAGMMQHTINSNVIFEAPIPAALVVSGPTITIDGTGGFEISGEDMRMPSRGSGSGFLKPAYGIMVKSGDQATTVKMSMDSTKMKGEGGAGSVISGAEIAWFETLYAEAAAHTGVAHPSAPYGGTYGNATNPSIVHISGDFNPTSSFSGAGLLVIEDGNVTINTDFSWEGIVMIRKATVANMDILIGGSAKIYGSLVAYEAITGPVGTSCDDVPFEIAGLETIPQVDYKVRFDVLGAAISAGGAYDMPVTAQLHVGDGLEQPWGSWDRALDGNLNTGLVYDWEPTDALAAGTPLTISSRSWSKNKGTDGSNESDWSVSMEQNSVSGGKQLKVLRDGDDVPNIKGYLDQGSVEDFVGSYIGADGKMSLAKNQAIYLFELGSTNEGSAAFDMQDLVVVVTLAAAEGSCAVGPLASGEINMSIAGNAGLYYSGEAIAKLGKELMTVRNETKVVVASQKEVASE